MKKKSIQTQEEVKALQGKGMTRKQAIQKSGYIALSAATMMLLFNNKAQAVSPHSAPQAPTDNSNNNQKGIWDD